jgi:hypothetical protein
MTGKDVDALLDRALARYSQEPRPGLEQRILNGIRLNREKKRRLILAWAFALPMLAGGLLLSFLRNPRTLHHEAAQAAIHKVRSSAPLSARLPVVARNRKPLPTQAIFPAPVPLTDGERALLALAAQYPAAAELAINLGKNNSEPIEIAPLDIQPLPTQSGQ